MALFPRVKVWVSNETLSAADLNAEFNNILNNFSAANVTGYSANVSQMQTSADPGGVGSESLAGSTAEELTRLRYMWKWLTGKTQWYDRTGRNLGIGLLSVKPDDIDALAVTTAKIDDLAVTTAKINAGAVTGPKMAAQVRAVSSSCGSFSTVSTSFITVTNLSRTLTTVGGRGVMLILQGDATTDSFLEFTCVSNNGTGSYRFMNGASTVSAMSYNSAVTSPQTLLNNRLSIPLMAYDSSVIGTPGTYTYTFQVKVGANTTCNAQALVLHAIEM